MVGNPSYDFILSQISSQGHRYLRLFALVFPNLRRYFYVKIGRKYSRKALALLFVVGILNRFSKYNPARVSEIKPLYQYLSDELKSRYSLNFSMDRSNIRKFLNRLYENGYLVRELVDAKSKEYKAYAYALSHKGETVFDHLLNVLDSSPTATMTKLYLSKSDKAALKTISSLTEDESIENVEEKFVFFKSKKDYETVLEWASSSLIILPNNTTSTSRDVELYLRTFFDDKSYPFAALYRNSVFLRADVHYFYATAGKYLDYFKEIVSLKKQLKELRKQETLSEYTSLQMKLKSIYREILTKHGRGLKEALFFLDRDLLDDPFRHWLKVSSVVSSIVKDAVAKREDGSVLQTDSPVFPTYLIIPTDSKFYELFKDTLNINKNMLDKVFIVDGTPLFVSNSFKKVMGTAYICPHGHIYWAPPNEPEPTHCPVCGKEFVEIKPVKLEVVAMDIAPPNENLIFKVYVPMDLLYFMNLNFNLSAGFANFLVIDASDYIPERSDASVYLAIGYLPLRTKPAATEEEKRFLREDLAKKKTWEILDMFSTYLYSGIVGYDHAKVAAMFVALSQTTKRLRKATISKNKIRLDASQYDLQHPPAPLYALFIGKPGTGKSSLAKSTLFYANPMFGKYAYVNLSRASPAGITAASIMAQGSKRKIYLGIERVAHGTMLVYDETDKAKDNSTLQAIADTMSEGLFTYDKAYASMLRELAITAKILVANDHMSLDETFDTFDMLYDYLMNPKNYSREERVFRGFVSNVIDRFDFIVYFPRIYDTVDLIKKYLEIMETVEIKQDEINRMISLFSAYVHMVRNFSNENKFYITREAVEAIYEYLEFIKKEDYALYKYLSSPRRLDTIYKLSRVIAAMHFRNEITVEDVKEAIAFLLYVITYPFANHYKNLLSYFKEELGIFYKYMEAFAENIDYKKIVLSDEELASQQSSKVTIKSRAELTRFIKALLRSYNDEYITKEQIFEMFFNRLNSGKIIVKPIRSWNIHPPLEESLREEIDKIITKLETEGVLLYAGPSKYMVNKNLL